MDQVKSEIQQQCHELARRMVQLDGWIREAYGRHDWATVGELQQQRERVQAYQSGLMRQVWERRNVREALRQARV